VNCPCSRPDQTSLVAVSTVGQTCAALAVGQTCADHALFIDLSIRRSIPCVSSCCQFCCLLFVFHEDFDMLRRHAPTGWCSQWHSARASAASSAHLPIAEPASKLLCRHDSSKPLLTIGPHRTNPRADAGLVFDSKQLQGIVIVIAELRQSRV
jgi:hypothetical protein